MYSGMRWGRGCLWMGAFMRTGDLCRRGVFVLGVKPKWAIFGAPIYLSLCKIWMKSDKPCPTYSVLTYGSWLPSAILDFQGKHICTIPHIVRPRCLRTYQIWWICLDLQWIYAPKTNFEKKRPFMAEFYFRFQGWPPPSFGVFVWVTFKISVRLDNHWPSYNYLTNSRSPPFSILDFRRKPIWTIHCGSGAHFLHTHTHTKFGEHILISSRDVPPKRNAINAPW